MTIWPVEPRAVVDLCVTAPSTFNVESKSTEPTPFKVDDNTVAPVTVKVPCVDTLPEVFATMNLPESQLIPPLAFN